MSSATPSRPSGMLWSEAAAAASPPVQLRLGHGSDRNSGVHPVRANLVRRVLDCHRFGECADIPFGVVGRRCQAADDPIDRGDVDYRAAADARRAGIACLQPRNIPLAWTSRMPSHSWSEVSLTVAIVPVPALFTSTFSAP